MAVPHGSRLAIKKKKKLGDYLRMFDRKLFGAYKKKMDRKHKIGRDGRIYI